MKGFITITLCAAFIVGAYAAPANTDDIKETTPKQCQLYCSLELNPVCGYDGSCYQQFPNKCIYDSQKCTTKPSLETVDTSLCDLATKNNHPNYKTCDA